jgi:hypothetical protein
MSIIIQTKRCKLSSRFRHLIESYIRRAMRREQRLISRVTLTITPTTLVGEPGFQSKIRIWSHYLGDIVVDDVGDTVWSTTLRVTSRARHALRRRLHKRLSKYRRIKRGEFAPAIPDVLSRGRGLNFGMTLPELSPLVFDCDRGWICQVNDARHPGRRV